MPMRWPNVLVAMSLFSLVLISILNAASASDHPADAQVPFTVNDFDWREMAPSLFAASKQPGQEGLKTLLENSRVLRSYIAREVQTECKPGNSRCDSSRDDFTVNGEVTRRIDGIVQEGMLHRNKTSSVDYTMDKSFPFSEVGAMRSDNREDAYFLLQLPDRSYTAARVEAKYGTPYDTDIVQWYSVYKYRLDSPQYTSRAVFEIDPTDGAVLKIAISLKIRKHH